MSLLPQTAQPEADCITGGHQARQFSSSVLFMECLSSSAINPRRLGIMLAVWRHNVSHMGQIFRRCMQLAPKWYLPLRRRIFRS